MTGQSAAGAASTYTTDGHGFTVAAVLTGEDE